MTRWLMMVMAVAAAVPCRGLVLDWNVPGVDWPDPLPRVLSQSFDIDPSNPGNDITITIAEVGGAGFLQVHGSGNQPPNDVAYHTGGTPGNESLFFNVDFAEENGADYLLITVDFLYANGVNFVEFSIFDVDRVTPGSQNFVDALTNFAGVSGNTTVFPTLTGSANNVISGSGATVRADGLNGNADASATANVLVEFGNAAVTQVSFRYTSGDVVGTDANPTSQSIGFSAVGFEPVVPEPGTWAAGAVLLGVALWGAVRRCRLTPAR